MSILLALLFFLFLNKPILASEDRNIFGLHLTQPEDIHQASQVINSSGGDWGWATLVIRADELSHRVWQDFFDNCRQYHIIPIIRIATTMEENNWSRPNHDQIDQQVEFLHSLNWPTATQHVTIFNEINHGTEWGGEVDIKDYVDKFIYTSQKLKQLNPNFYILSAGLDLAPPEKPPAYKSAPSVYREILNYKPDFFDYVDAIASHSYPNHGFVGTPNDQGQHSIRGYQWELSFIKSLGVTKDLPVFITETGWPHRDGSKNKKNNRFYTSETAAKFLNTALDIWTKDNRVKAVTPFIFNYPNPPFESFSWLDNQKTLYPAYEILVQRPKTANSPPQITNYQLVDIKFPFLIFSENDYSGEIILKNTGQTIWGENNFCLAPKASSNVRLDAICISDNSVYPGQTHKFNFKFSIKPDSENQNTHLSWDGLPGFEVKPLTNKSTVFRPETKIKNKITEFFKNLFI